MKLLGAILAGGQSRRFGSDKALALLDGIALIEHVRRGLAPQVDTVIVCGREMVDRPRANLGPLGGLCAALHYAQNNGFDAVLSAGCDVLPVPNMDALQGDGPAYIEGQYLFGFWPAALAQQLESYLQAADDFSLKNWCRISGIGSVRCAESFYNLNTPDDLAAYANVYRRGA
jgi:molybdenum cofactor guanylyltransferase